jgi:F-type H+-transporting ATPase subunit a
MVVDTMGEHNAKFLPLIGTFFLSSIFGSLIGMTGFLRSATADLSVPLVWAITVTAVIWYNNIKNNGFVGWLKGFTEPVVVMTPMNIVSEIAQPVSMAFRHFGNVAGGGVITSILYTALTMASSLALNAIASSGWAVAVVLLAVGAALLFAGIKKHKLVPKIFAGIFLALGLFGLLQALGILSGVPIFAFGIPAVLSVYFDIFSGFVQALVFSLLSMVYIAGSCPPPEEANS